MQKCNKILALSIIFLFCSATVKAEEYLLPKTSTKPMTKNILLEDELIKNIKVTNQPTIKNYKFEDELLKNLDYKKIKKINVNLTYDFTNINQIILPIKPINHISSKEAIVGDVVKFILIQQVKINNNTIIPKGTKITATIEYVLPGQIKGEPGILIINRFNIEGFSHLNPEGEIYKEGAKRSFWILPLAKLINAFTIAGGYPIYLIKGGEAQILPEKIYKIYL